MTDNKLPIGIRERNGTYQAIVTRHSKQYSASFKDITQAIKWREEKIQELNKGSSTRGSRTCTLEEAVSKTIDTRWADTKAERTSTVNANNIMRYFGPQTKLTALTTQAVEKFIEAQKKSGLSNATINRKLACLSVILKTAEDYGYITAQPRLIRRKEYKGRDRFLNIEEEKTITLLFKQFEQIDNLDVFTCLLDTGMRISELLHLQVSDVDFAIGKHGVLTVWCSKNNKPRSVPMTDRVNQIIHKRVEAAAWERTAKLFEGVTQSSFRVGWDRVRQMMGLDDDTQFVPHILRHTCASRLVRSGVPLAIVQQWLGHLSIQSTMRYAHLAPTSLYQYVE